MNIGQDIVVQEIPELLSEIQQDSAAVANQTAEVVSAIKTVFDPEIPVNVYDLGLIYSIQIDALQQVMVQMTLTSPTCPAAQTLPGMVVDAIKQLVWVTDCQLELVWDPPWTKDRMSEVARLELGMFY